MQAISSCVSMKKMKDETELGKQGKEPVENQLDEASETLRNICVRFLKFPYFQSEATAEVKKLLKDPLNWKNAS